MLESLATKKLIDSLNAKDYDDLRTNYLLKEAKHRLILQWEYEWNRKVSPHCKNITETFFKKRRTNITLSRRDKVANIAD